MVTDSGQRGMERFGRSPDGFRPLYPDTNAAGICENLEREFPQDGVGFRDTSSAKIRPNGGGLRSISRVIR